MNYAMRTVPHSLIRRRRGLEAGMAARIETGSTPLWNPISVPWLIAEVIFADSASATQSSGPAAPAVTGVIGGRPWISADSANAAD